MWAVHAVKGLLSLERLCRNVADYPVVIPSEREGSKTDFSLSVETRISRGALSIAEGLEMTRVVKRNGISAIATQSLTAED